MWHLFELARDPGSFTYYGTSHSFQPLYYLNPGFMAIVIVATCSVVLLTCFLPVMKHPVGSLLMGLLLTGSGGSAAYCLIVPEWQVGQVELPRGLAGSYWEASGRVSFQPLRVGLGLGLTTANITLTNPPYGNQTNPLYLDEQVSLGSLRKECIAALRRGLPAPVLSVACQLSDLGRRASRAGRFASYAALFSLVTWVAVIVLHLAALPHHSSDALCLFGWLQITCASLYHCLQLGDKPGLWYLYVDGLPLRLHYGPCFWTCVVVGSVAALMGHVLRVVYRRDGDFWSTDFPVREADFTILSDRNEEASFNDGYKSPMLRP